MTGIPWGFRDLDRLTSGSQPAKSSSSPRALRWGVRARLSIAANLGVRSRIPVALFTLEMSKAEVTQRLMWSEAKVESRPRPLREATRRRTGCASRPRATS